LISKTTPSLELISNFSDEGKWFEFGWVIFRPELQIHFYLGKSRKPKEIKRKSPIFKKFSDGVKRFEFEGGGNKVNKYGND
jgi:hypothetical protein